MPKAICAWFEESGRLGGVDFTHSACSARALGHRSLVASFGTLPQDSGTAMGNGYYEPGEQRAARVHALFNRIAARYDLINDLQSIGLHRLWKNRMVRMARPQRDTRALDVCCGTGDLTLRLASHGAQVTGLDFSPNMLEIARRRSASVSGKVRFIEGDAQRTPFENGSFQIVCVGYGLRNLKDWQAGLVEMARVAAPGGRLLVLDFGKPKNRLWRAAYFSYLRVCVPLFGLLFCGNASAYSYILESLKHYPAQEGVETKMKEMGLERVRTVNVLGGAMSINYGEKPAR